MQNEVYLDYEKDLTPGLRLKYKKLAQDNGYLFKKDTIVGGYNKHYIPHIQLIHKDHRHEFPRNKAHPIDPQAKLYHCPFCLMVYPSSKGLHTHWERERSNELKKTITLQFHQNLHKGFSEEFPKLHKEYTQATYKCHGCGQGYATNELLNKHKNSNLYNNYCKKFDKPFTQTPSLKNKAVCGVTMALNRFCNRREKDHLEMAAAELRDHYKNGIPSLDGVNNFLDRFTRPDRDDYTPNTSFKSISKKVDLFVALKAVGKANRIALNAANNVVPKFLNKDEQ